jgi:hypothetical protein
MAEVRSSQIIDSQFEAEDPQLTVVPDDRPLKPGTYVVTLVVTDDVGQQSEQATWKLEVRDAPRVEIVGPSVVAFNQNIPLVAKVSTNGAIKSYAWSVRNA